MFFPVRRLGLSIFIASFALSEAHAIEDTYEVGSDSVVFSETIHVGTENYRKRIESLGVGAHHFSPAYSAGRDMPFWDRVNEQAPTPEFFLRSLVRVPKHLIWDTPGNMGKTLKDNYIDTWSESDGALAVGSDLLKGIPNTLMVGVNGVWDTATNLYTDLYQPLLGVVILWPLRFATGLLKEPAPAVYTVVDAPVKALWSFALSFRKTLTTLGDQTQKLLNFSYRSVTDPFDISDHAERYWGTGGQSSGD